MKKFTLKPFVHNITNAIIQDLFCDDKFTELFIFMDSKSTRIYCDNEKDPLNKINYPDKNLALYDLINYYFQNCKD